MKTIPPRLRTLPPALIHVRMANVTGALCLSLGLLSALAPMTSHAALLSRWVARDWDGGTSDWVDRVGGKIATVSSSANSPAKTPGVLPQTGLVFDGVDDYLSVATSQNPIIGKTSVTIAAYILTTNGASGSDNSFWFFPGPLNGESPNYPNDWGLVYDALGNARAFFNNAITPSPAVSLIDGQPHTMILTWQDPTDFPGQGVARLYVDGVLVGSTGPTDGGNGIFANRFTIGADNNLIRFFKGAIGELRFYDSVENAALLHSQIINDLLVATTANSGLGSLRQTVASAPANETILFHPDLSGQTISMGGAPILIDKNLTLDASALPDGIELTGGSASRVFDIGSGSTVTLQGLTIRNSGATVPVGSGRYGGGILNEGNLTLRRCLFRNNYASHSGGGIYSEFGNLTIEDCTFDTNQAQGGSGGGIFIGGGVNTVTGCTFWRNSTIAADGNGGGIANLDAVTTISNCTFNANSAKLFGGAVMNEEGSVGNDQILTIVHSTVAGNSASKGSGLANARVLNLENSIVAANSIPSGGTEIYPVAGVINGGGANLIGSNDTVASEFPAGPLVGTKTRRLDPQLAPFSDYGGPTETMPPLLGSPAVDVAGSGVASDQRSLARPQGGGFDLGAVEYLPTVVTTAIDEDEVDPGTGLSLREATKSPFVSSITFDPAVFNGEPGDTILLTHGQLTIEKSVVINGSGLFGGVIISGNNASRVLEVSPDVYHVLRSLTITGGRGANGATGPTGSVGSDVTPGGIGGRGSAGENGGGILNRGTLDLYGVTVSGNAAGDGGRGGAGGPGAIQGTGGGAGAGGRGGGIYNTGTGFVTLLNSTIAGNTAGSGGNGGSGASDGDGGNGGSGGGIGNEGTLSLKFTTVTDNLAGDAGTGEFGAASHGTGGGVSSPGQLWSQNALVALNSAPGGQPDVSGFAAYAYGPNFIGDPSGASGFGTPGVNYLIGDPMLSPLGAYGGATMTRPPLAGSPVIDAVSAGWLANDQRGQSRPQGVKSDLGAVEGPFVPAGPVQSVEPTVLGDGTLRLRFTNFSGALFSVLASSDLMRPHNEWPTVGFAVEYPSGSGYFEFTDPQAVNFPRRFYRVSTP